MSSVFTELDKHVPQVITDLITSFLLLSHLPFGLDGADRIYQHMRDSFNLRIPKPQFKDTVWDDRFYHPDSQPGIKLAALGHITRIPIIGDRDLIDDIWTIDLIASYKGAILVSIFDQEFKDSGHPECSSAFTKWLHLEPDDITEGEWNYIDHHWSDTWLPKLVACLESHDDYHLRVRGLDALIAFMLQASLNFTKTGESCIRSSLEFIARELRLLDTSSFTRNVWVHHPAIFIHLMEALIAFASEVDDPQYQTYLTNQMLFWDSIFNPPESPPPLPSTSPFMIVGQTFDD